MKNLRAKANLESDFKKLKIDMEKDYQNFISGVNILRLSNNPIELKKEDLKSIILSNRWIYFLLYSITYLFLNQ